MNKKGFTIVELLLSSSFFSFVMLFVIFGFIQINRAYIRGNTVKLVQNSGRVVLESIVRDMRQTTVSNITTIDTDVTPNRLCLGGGIRYAWNEFEPITPVPVPPLPPGAFSTEVDGGGNVLTLQKSTDGAACSDPLPGNDTSVLPQGLVIQALNVDRIEATTGGADTNSYAIRLVLSTEDSSGTLPVQGTNAECIVGKGSQYCDVAVFETVVTVRN